MKITHKNYLPEFSLPLPIFTTLHIADAVSRDGEEFDIFIGLDTKCVEQLQKFSLDESDIDLQQNTGDRRRFGEGSYEEWYKKGRIPFCAIHKRTDALAALIWLGPKPLGKKSLRYGAEQDKPKPDEMNDNWHTISPRSYIPFRGKGIMNDFMRYAIDVYRTKFPNSKIWAGIDDRNIPSIRLFKSIGFELDEAASDPSANFLVMIKR